MLGFMVILVSYRIYRPIRRSSVLLEYLGCGGDIVIQILSEMEAASQSSEICG
jgi:hypothetical protein